MTIDDLRQLLSGLPGDMQIRLASHPHEHTIASALGFDEDGTIAYLAGNLLGRLPSDVAESLDW